MYVKLREGFVSNSSSSSFICDVCGDIHDDYDRGDSYTCERGHTFCPESIRKLTKKERKELIKYLKDSYEITEYDEFIKDDMTEFDDDEIIALCYEGGFEIPSVFCKVCMLELPTTWDKYLYTLRLLGKTDVDIMNEIKEKFKTIDEFEEYLNEDT